MSKEKVKCRYDGVDIELKLCKCGGQPYINSTPHGERWINCDCGESSKFYKDDNNPAWAFKKTCESWNRKKRRSKK